MIKKIKELQSLDYWPLFEIRDKLNEVIEAVNKLMPNDLYKEGLSVDEQGRIWHDLVYREEVEQEQPWKVGDRGWTLVLVKNKVKVASFILNAFGEIEENSPILEDLKFNAFRTREEAEEAARKIEEILKGRA